MNFNGTYVLWVMMMCQRRFVDNNKCTSVAPDVDSRGGCPCVRIGDMRELSVLHSQFFCKAKTALKK